MDLVKSGKLLKTLRKEKKLTQKELAEKLGVVAKTISKWETGSGFPDISMLSALADIFQVNERSLLSGCLTKNRMVNGNMKYTKFYVCPYCGNSIQSIGNSQIVCCGKNLQPLQAQVPDVAHTLNISEIENDFYIEIPHAMSKEHYISFVAYINNDRVLTWRLYPEQDCAVRIPKAYDGNIVYYCKQHGLFVYPLNQRRKASIPH